MYSTNERMRVRQVSGRASFILVLLYGITMKMIEPPRLVAKDYYLYISMSWCCVFLKRGWTFANLPSTTRFILHLRRWLDVCTQAISHLWIIQVTRIPIHCDPATIIKILTCDAVSGISDWTEYWNQCPPCSNFFIFLIFITRQQNGSLLFSVVRLQLAEQNDPVGNNKPEFKHGCQSILSTSSSHK